MKKKQIKIECIYNLSSVNFKKSNLFGIKGGMLGDIKKTKVNVPDGFVISAPVFNYFLEVNGLISEIEMIFGKTSIDSIQSVQKASEQIVDLIRDAKLPFELSRDIIDNFRKLRTARVIVRPSVTMREVEIASWSGELDYYSNVVEKILVDRIKECWSSLFSPRAIFYRYGRNLKDEHISLAIIVQKMLNSDVSGICYTRHPITEDYDQMLIEAGFGLGAGVIKGKIIPDAYVVKKMKTVEKLKARKNFEILSKKVLSQNLMVTLDVIGIKEARVPESKKDQQKLTDNQIEELAEICRKVEKIFKTPQEIEWALEKGKFYIVQTRPLFKK